MPNMECTFYILAVSYTHLIEKRLQEDFYVLIGENEKKIISESLEIKTILPNNLEDELKKYYEI